MTHNETTRETIEHEANESKYLHSRRPAGPCLTACNKEMDNPLADGPVAAQVTAGISQTLTRVSANANGISASFTNGDIINVVADGSATYVYTL